MVAKLDQRKPRQRMNIKKDTIAPRYFRVRVKALMPCYNMCVCVCVCVRERERERERNMWFCLMTHVHGRKPFSVTFSLC